MIASLYEIRTLPPVRVQILLYDTLLFGSHSTLKICSFYKKFKPMWIYQTPLEYSKHNLTVLLFAILQSSVLIDSFIETKVIYMEFRILLYYLRKSACLFVCLSIVYWSSFRHSWYFVVRFFMPESFSLLAGATRCVIGPNGNCCSLMCAESLNNSCSKDYY